MNSRAGLYANMSAEVISERLHRVVPGILRLPVLDFHQRAERDSRSRRQILEL